jgi:hypothetical protein
MIELRREDAGQQTSDQPAEMGIKNQSLEMEQGVLGGIYPAYRTLKHSR